MNTEDLISNIKSGAIEYLPKIALAIAIWVIGSWLIKILNKGISKMMDKKNLDPSLKTFLYGLINISLKILLAISVLGTLGIEMTSFIAILGAAGLAIGMALSGTLQNFAGSVIILLFKPYKVGDYIEAESYKGFVKEIHIFNTVLNTLDNKTVVIPNGTMSNTSLVNYTAEPTRRVDWLFGIAYGDDFQKAKKTISALASKDSRILNQPPLFIAISELNSSSVDITVRGWVKNEDYWDVFFQLNELVYENFEKEGLSIPFPQMDVHLKK